MPGHDTARDVYRQALPVILVSLVAGLFSGTILGSETMRAGISEVPGLLLLLPAFLATRGASMARLAHASRPGSTKGSSSRDSASTAGSQTRSSPPSSTG